MPREHTGDSKHPLLTTKQITLTWKSPDDQSVQSVQFTSVALPCLTLCTSIAYSTPGFPVHHQLPELKLMPIKSVMPSKHLILCHPLLLPSILPSIKVFSSESVLPIRCPKYQSFSFSIFPLMNIQDRFPLGLTGLISLQSQESSPTPQFKSINSSDSTFFMVQLPHTYVITGNTIALTMWTFVGKVYVSSF